MGKPPPDNKEFSSDELYKMNNSGFYEDVHATTIAIEPPKEEKIVVLDNDISKNISNFLKELDPAIAKACELLKFETSICHNKKDSVHVLKMVNGSFLASLKTTFPDKDFSVMEEQMEDVKNSLTMLVSIDNKPNDLLVYYLLAILSSILK